ncbi:YaaR family protein [uncultured Tyzzerella sp.]|uniref:YaaR family protein n=1 Tax=uncultured Tyzzerella sp. TaxID=2321398 RepID=UPI002941BBF1|nr:YaaR family protein [uncultured Tyzzerella sp.]
MDLKVSDIRLDTLPMVEQKKEVKETEEFKFTLNKLENDNLMEKLNGLIDEITVQGKKISDHMDIKDMKKYRSLITEFMNEVVTNSHEFSRENFLDRRGRHRVYGIVKLVNKDLDELAQELIKTEKNHIAILDKTGEIRGLLLDLII